MKQIKTIIETRQYRLDKVTMDVRGHEVKWYEAYQRQRMGKHKGEWAHIGRICKAGNCEQPCSFHCKKIQW